MDTFDKALLLTVLLTACGGTQGPPTSPSDLGAQTHGDAQSDLGPAGGCTPSCGTGEVCSDGTCVALPSSCPCPAGAYCDLSDDTCHAGCVSDTTCAGGQYCDLASHACTTGCSTDSACNTAMGERCVGHTCGVPCQSDFDCGDGTSCSTPTCQANGLCAISTSPDGTPCPDDGIPCTTDVCNGGTCNHPLAPDGTTCPSDTAHCMAAQCMSGQCISSVAPEGTPCGAGTGRCIAQQCIEPAGTCKLDPATSGTYDIVVGSQSYTASSCYCGGTLYGGEPTLISDDDEMVHTYATCYTGCVENAVGMAVICW